MRHGLLVVRAPGRQDVPAFAQRLAQTGDVAVAEDGEDTGAERHLFAVDLDALGDQVADQRLRHRQSHAHVVAFRSAKIA